MSIIISFIIPFCFGFIVSRASSNGDKATVIIALLGIVADLILFILARGVTE